MFLVLQESVVNALGHEILPFGGIEELFLVGGGDESQLYQATRHRGLPEHEESSLMHALVHPPADGAHLTLDEFRQVQDRKSVV